MHRSRSKFVRRGTSISVLFFNEVCFLPEVPLECGFLFLIDTNEIMRCVHFISFQLISVTFRNSLVHAIESEWCSYYLIYHSSYQISALNIPKSANMKKPKF
jgi:hypothetical protein